MFTVSISGSRVSSLGVWVSGFGFRVSGPGIGAQGCRVSGLPEALAPTILFETFLPPDFGFWVSGFEFRFGFQVSDIRLRVSGFGYQVSGFGVRRSGFGFRVPGLIRPIRTPLQIQTRTDNFQQHLQYLAIFGKIWHHLQDLARFVTFGNIGFDNDLHL